jgi:predicted ATPase
LAGLNGTGKTSVIQALLLCRAATDAKRGTVQLNGGPFCLELGTAEDILRGCLRTNVLILLNKKIKISMV